MPKEICYYCNIDQRLDEECLSLLMARFREEFQNYLRKNENPPTDSLYRRTLINFWESKKKDCNPISIGVEGFVGRKTIYICKEHLEEIQEVLSD